MRYQIILIMIMTYLVFGLDESALKLGLEYFKYRNIKFICLLSCKMESLRIIEFSKSASNLTIAVSSVPITSSPDFTRIEKCLQRQFYPIGVIIDSTCQGIEDILYYASENMLLDSMHKWLIIDNDDAKNDTTNEEEINTFGEKRNTTMIEELNSVDIDVMAATKLYGESIETLSNLNISVDTDIVIAIKVLDANAYTLYDVYNYGKVQGGSLMVDEVGSWDQINGLKMNVSLNVYKYYRRWDFHNISMRMMLVGLGNFNAEGLLSVKQYPGVALVTQTASAILYEIADIHNFRYIIKITDRWIGTYEKNSTKVVSNSLYFRLQDISPVIRYLPTVFGRFDVANLPVTSIETRYYYKIPTTGPGKFENQFLRPLSPTTWWCIIGVSILCAILLLLSAVLEHRPSCVQYAVFSVIATICQQFFEDIDDNTTKRSSTARKTTILVTGLSCVLIYNYYTSSVVSWLLNGPPPSINSLRELLDSPLELIYEDVGYTRSWLQTPIYYYNKRNAKIEEEIRQKKVFNKKKGAPIFEPVVQGIKMVQMGGYAYHTDVNSANALISRTFSQEELCDLGSLQSMEQTMLYSCLQRNSPFTKFFSWSLLRLRERGITSIIQIRRYSLEVKCEGSSPRALALGGAAPAFILLAGGFVLATAIMMVERFVHQYKKNAFSNSGNKNFVFTQ